MSPCWCSADSLIEEACAEEREQKRQGVRGIKRLLRIVRCEKHWLDRLDRGRTILPLTSDFCRCLCPLNSIILDEPFLRRCTNYRCSQVSTGFNRRVTKCRRRAFLPPTLTFTAFSDSLYAAHLQRTTTNSCDAGFSSDPSGDVWGARMGPINAQSIISNTKVRSERASLNNAATFQRDPSLFIQNHSSHLSSNTTSFTSAHLPHSG